MDYLLFKALHVASVVIWVGGMLVGAVAFMVLAALPTPRSPSATKAIAIIRRWDKNITTPAMLIAWGVGIYMAVTSGWFYAPWLNIKLLIVIVLSGLHGTMSGGLRRLAIDPDRQAPAHMKYAAPLVLVSIALIAFLVIVKPF